MPRPRRGGGHLPWGRLFDAKTDTEAIGRALHKAITDREIEDSLEALLREGRFRTLYR